MKNNHNDQTYVTSDPELDARILELARLCGSSDFTRHFLREIFTTVAKLGMESEDLGDYKLINVALKELRHAFRTFTPYRGTHKAVIFGSARTPESDPRYRMARDVSEKLAASGFMIITGAGPGIMEAANEGAGADRSFGINIKLPFEQMANPHIKGDPKMMTFKYFFTRKLIFIKESDATVLFPGGFGTLDEGFENLTLFQTGKGRPRPIVLLEPPDSLYWKKWMNYVRQELLDEGYISPDDLKLFYHTHSVEEAVTHIRDFYKVYHSLRYVDNQTVLRLNRPVPQELVDELNRDFKDIIRKGDIQISEPFKKEIQRNEYPDLPRLVFNFNKQSFGRLNEMIWRLNRFSA